jgi:hypothetical protein
MNSVALIIVLVVALFFVSVAIGSRRRSRINEYRQMGASVSTQGTPSFPTDTCLRCHGPLDSVGVEEFRIGGTSGGWKLLFGEWAELGEDKVPLDVFVCRRCRQVEFRMP